MTPMIIMFIAGVILILAEFFLPGMILGIIGFCLIIASTITGVVTYPEYAVFIVAGELVGFFVSLFAGFYLMTQSPLQKLFVLDDTMSAADGYTGPGQDPALVGRQASVYTALRPAGTILVDKERIDAVSTGTFIDAGETVTIITVNGNRVVVEEVEEMDKEEIS